jgi:hypothetical protein
MIVKGGLAMFVMAALVFFFRPVCVPLSQDNLASFNQPAKQRMAQRDLYLKVWQEKAGQWFQCKTYFSRLRGI